MAFSFRRFIKGILLKKENSSPTDNINGSIWNLQDTDLEAYIDNAAHAFVFKQKSATLTNKSISADLNTITELEVDNLKSGVLDTDLNSVSALDDTIPSAKAVKAYVDQQDDAQNEASEISYDNTTSGLVATNAQDAIDEVEGRVDNSDTHIAASSGVHGVSSNVVGVSDVQEISNKNLDNSSTKFINTGDSTKQVQVAIGAGHATSSQLTLLSEVTANRTLTFPDDTATLVGDDTAQTITNKTIDADNNTISNLEHGAEVDDPTTGVHGVGAGEIVGTTLTQTLTNKTLDSATLNGSFSGTGVETAITGTSNKLVDSAAVQAWAPKFNATASAPGVSDDSSAGYTIGSMWLDTTTNLVYYASDVSVGAATWRRILVSFSSTQQTIGGEIFKVNAGLQVATGGDFINFGKDYLYVIEDSSTTGANATVSAVDAPVVRLTNVSLTSIDTLGVNSPPGGTQQLVYLINNTGSTITINDGSGITTGKGASVELIEDGMVALYRNPSTNTWMLLGPSLIDTNSLASGVLDTDLSTVSGSDDTLASAKAIKTYVDAQVSGGSVVKYDSGWVTVSAINDTPATGTHRLTTTLSAYPSQISLTLDDGTNIFPGDLASRVVFREITGTYYVEIDTDGLDSTDQFRVHAWV
jgi:hypothetical protein